MQEVEKIIEDIDLEISKQKALCEDLGDTAGWSLYEKTMKRAKDIIRKYIGDDWKRVEDALPEDGVEVLITYRGTDGQYYVHVDEYDQECGWATGWDDDIVAWKELPDPYRPENTAETPDWRDGMLKKFNRRE